MPKCPVVDREETIRLFKRGWNLRAIALELRCNTSTIYRITRGIQRTEKSTSQTERDAEIVRLMKEGATNTEIAIQFRMSRHTVATLRTKHGIPWDCNAKRIKQAMQAREQVLRVAGKGLQTLREIANEAGVTYRVAQQTLHDGSIPFKNAYGGNQEYQPTEPLVHVPSENPWYPGFDLEASAVERLQEIRQLHRQALARGELGRSTQRRIT